MFTGGEAVPYERAARFEDVTGARVLQFYGSNETGALSRTTMRDDREHRLQTAGRIIPEMHVRLLDDDGRDITDARRRRQPGVQGPGHLPRLPRRRRAPTRSCSPTDGWMRIGDLCDDRRRRLPAGGRPHIRHHHPRRQEHQRARGRGRGRPSTPRSRSRPRWRCPTRSFGERVCLYAELQPGTTLELDDVVGHLRERGVSPEWFPERLVVVDALPARRAARWPRASCAPTSVGACDAEA